MKIISGEIIPNSGIDKFKLGMSRSELLKFLGEDFRERKLNYTNSKIIIENAMFWVCKDSVRQIGITKGFEGKYKNIGIGSTLNDVKKYFGNYEKNYDTYNPIDEKGICFELEDIDDWNELTAPIEWIFVYTEL